MSCPQINLLTGPHHTHKLIVGSTFVLKFQAEPEFDYQIWTNWNNHDWHVRNVKEKVTDHGKLFFVLLKAAQTGFFKIIIRYKAKRAKKYQESDRKLEIHVDPLWIEKAIVYNIFIRAYGAKAKDQITPSEGGTFEEVIQHMDNLVKLGIDVIYLNPFHQIGELYRKFNPNDHLPYYLQPGSPYSI